MRAVTITGYIITMSRTYNSLGQTQGQYCQSMAQQLLWSVQAVFNPRLGYHHRKTTTFNQIPLQNIAEANAQNSFTVPSLKTQVKN